MGEHMQIYINSTIHHDWNVKFNPELCKALEEKGITCHLPQRDTNQKGIEEERFRQNTEGIKNADIMLVVASNESPNWGVELGYAYGLEKKIVALATTTHPIPLMAKYIVSQIITVDDLDDISSYIGKLVEALK